MSVTALQDSAKELRRLAIAGSALAKDDFRLKKLIPEIQKTGASVPVFAKVATSLESLTAAKDTESAAALLQVTTLVHAVLYTQVGSTVDGDLAPLETFGITFSSKPTAAKTLRAVMEALTQTGSGRLEIVKNAFEAGCFQDLRLLKPALRSFNDPYPDVADFMYRNVMPLYGKAILPLVRADFNPKGGTADQRRLRVMAGLMETTERRAFCLDLLENGSKEVRVGAIEAIGTDPECLSAILNHIKDRSDEVRQAAYRALGKHKSDLAKDTLFKAIVSKDSAMAVEGLGENLDKNTAQRLIAIADELLGKLLAGEKDVQIVTYINMLRPFITDNTGLGTEHMIRVYGNQKKIAAIKPTGKSSISGADIVHQLRSYLALSNDERAADALLKTLDLKDPMECFEACVRTKSPKLVYDTFQTLVSSDKYSKRSKEEFIDRFIMHLDFGCAKYGRGDHEEDDDNSEALIKDWDARWIDLALKAKHNEFICALLRSEDKKVIKHVEDLARNSKSAEDFVVAMAALARVGYSDWMGLLMHRLRETSSSAKASAYGLDLLQEFLGCFRYSKLSDKELEQLDTITVKLAERHETILKEKLYDEKHRRAMATKG